MDNEPTYSLNCNPRSLIREEVLNIYPINPAPHAKLLKDLENVGLLFKQARISPEIDWLCYK